jgi:hypothetical protein
MNLHESKVQKLWENNAMTNKINLIAIGLLATLLLGGCVNDRVAQPSNITLVNALHDLGAGLAELKAAELEMVATNECLRNQLGTNDFITGLFPSEVVVTFNVTAGTSKNNQLSIDLNASVPNVPVGGKIGDTFSSQSSTSRGNQITIKFTSVLFATTKTTTTATNGTKVTEEQNITDPATLEKFWKAIGGGSVSVARSFQSNPRSTNGVDKGDFDGDKPIIKYDTKPGK